MKILVTGGAGFIGSHVAERLLARGDQVAIIDNLNTFYDPAVKRANLELLRARHNFEFYPDDILDRNAMERIFRLEKPDRVVHLAARAGVRPSLSDPVLYAEVNVTGTAVLLELARQFEVGNFLFGSSSSVYGAAGNVTFREDDPVAKPISPYAATKRAGELLCYSYHHNCGLRVCCLRFFTVYGPRQRPDMAIAKFAGLITQGRALPVYAHGNSERDYTYVSDIVDGVIAALDAQFNFEIFNLGTGRSVKLLDLISLLENALEIRAQRQELPAQDGDVPFTCADISKARTMLNYQPQCSIECGISRFVEWFCGRQKASPAHRTE
ncbi:MAG: GDP-mannose 4,6-dehydratase [Acidobacteria bacterium]|nr:GDP-mannose 4,6-dehydratase [Acidobacteriota bacterium]